MAPLAFTVEFLHVFFAIFWFGATLAMFAIVTPVLHDMSPAAATEFGASFGPRVVKVLGPVGGLTILFGIINATIFGPVKSLSFLWSGPYGITVTIAFVLALVVAVLGAQTGRAGESIPKAPAAERPAIMQRLVRLQVLSIVGFLAILVCMLLMHDAM